MKIQTILLGVVCFIIFCGCKKNNKTSVNDSKETFSLEWNNTVQTIDGFGVAQAGWTRELFSFSNREAVMSKLFGEDGLKLNILRGEIFPHYCDGQNDKDFNINEDISAMPTEEDYNNKEADDLLRRGQLWISKYAKEKFDLDKLIFAAWSPPVWMKTNSSDSIGVYASQGKLKKQCYQDFADYLAGFYEAYDSMGVAPYAISPSNEPGYAAPWNSCTWTANEMGEFISSFLIPTFEKRNIPSKVIFGENPLWTTNYAPIAMVSSKDFVDTVLDDYPQMPSSRLIAAGHGYALTPEIMPIKLSEEELKTPIVPFESAVKKGIPVWVTEISDITPLDTSMQDGMNWAVTFHKYLTEANVNAIVWWCGAMPTTTNESLIILDKNRSDFVMAKRYDVFGNFSRYIPEGSKRVNVKSANDDSKLLVSAYTYNNSYSIVVLNPTDQLIEASLSSEGRKFSHVMTQYITDMDNTWKSQDIVNHSKDKQHLSVPAQSIITLTGTLK